jgi:hypothetical protein
MICTCTMPLYSAFQDAPALPASLCESFVVHGIEVSARAILSLLRLLLIQHFCLLRLRAYLPVSAIGWENGSLTMCFSLQKSKSSSPAGSHGSSHSHRRSRSAGSHNAVVGLDSSSGIGDYRLNPSLTDDQTSHLS